MKKIVSVIFAAFLVISAFAVDLEIRVVPQFNIVLPVKNSKIPSDLYSSVGFGGFASFDIAPITVRGKDSVYFSAQGGIKSVALKSTVPVGDFLFYDGGLAAGYNFRFMDRISVFGEICGGIYSMPTLPDKLVADMSDAQKDLSKDGFSGIYAGGNVGANYYLLPELSATVSLGYKSYLFSQGSCYSDFSIGVGIKYNLKEGLAPTTAIEPLTFESEALFPVFYSRYNDNKFGSVTFVNNEKTDITDVEVQVFIEQYMMNPKTVAVIDYVESGEEFSADLTAFLNENILNSMLAKKVDSRIIVNYRSLGKKKTFQEVVELQSLSRNSMSWEDDRRAAAFVSGRDASALMFARQVVSIVKNELRSDKPVNMQYAAAIFGALKAYGINYVIDPASAFTDNVGSASIDFLQFPYQTLLYHGGDCDDLTILNCSLLEAIGIPTAFITVPGHIYMAFDAGVSADVADEQIGKGKYILKNGQVWVPVEITVSQDTFGLALSIGLREWKKYESEAAIIPLKYAWAEYKPVSIPESDIALEMPSKEKILKGFKEAIK